MIPRDFIFEWSKNAPWPADAQVEQDLLISRALIEIFKHQPLRGKLSFRGGTALHKLHLPKPLRYSEDLDFIQTKPEAIGPTLDALRSVLDPWLGEPRRELKEGLIRLLYRFVTEDGSKAKLKIEINSREHVAAQEVIDMPYAMASRWYSGEAQVSVLSLPWLLGSKLRALYQRRKGRDLFDLAVVLERNLTTPEQIIDAFLFHLKESNQSVSRAELEENLCGKINDATFLADLGPLLGGSATQFDMTTAHEFIMATLIAKVPGDPWKGGVDNKNRTSRR
jgi:predicted nucleotidyltransferase component of viral defense system